MLHLNNCGIELWLIRETAEYIGAGSRLAHNTLRRTPQCKYKCNNFQYTLSTSHCLRARLGVAYRIADVLNEYTVSRQRYGTYLRF